MSLNRHAQSRLTRRHLLAGSGAAVAAVTAPGALRAQEATPVAGVAAVELEAFRALCETVTGFDEITDDAGLQQLLGLMVADEQMSAGLVELLALGDGVAALEIRDLDFPVVVVLTNILQFWFLGEFRNAALANRADRIGELLTYRTLPYVTTPAVCKAFAYWAIDPQLPDRAAP